MQVDVTCEADRLALLCVCSIVFLFLPPSVLAGMIVPFAASFNCTCHCFYSEMRQHGKRHRKVLYIGVMAHSVCPVCPFVLVCRLLGIGIEIDIEIYIEKGSFFLFLSKT